MRRFTDLKCMARLMASDFVESGFYGKRKRLAAEFINIGPKLKKYILQKKSSQRGGVI